MAYLKYLLLLLAGPFGLGAGEGKSPAAAGDWFSDVTEAVGVTFTHSDCRSGERYYVETAASGGGWWDYDHDGDLDLYLISGSLTPGSKETVAPRNVLYENRDGRFIDVTVRAGVGDSGFGMGMCLGDYDGDGLLDLYVTNYGANRLYRNRGDGRFEEVSAKAGVDGGFWSTGCAFGDVDGDGDLDLYVANYVDFAFDKNPKCGNATTNTLSYCRPSAFKGLNDYLYINQGDGSFREEALKRGIRQEGEGKCFGVLLSDVDTDGDLDIFVVSDGTMNRFYINDGRGFFEDQSLLSGLGFNQAGQAEAGMGLDLGDADGDGLLDLFVTNYSHETNTLYRNLGDLYFEDQAREAGLAEPSIKYVAWGTCWLDFDNDGDLDLAVANGHVIDNVDVIEPNSSYPQPNQLFMNDGKGHFKEVSREAGDAFTRKRVSRGLAAGDWDNDGKIDLVVVNTNHRADVLRNRFETQGHWLGLRLVGPAHNRFAIGARVQLRAEGFRAVREVRSGGSFLSQNDLRLHFGLGNRRGPFTAEVYWPGGKLQTVKIQTIDRYLELSYQPDP